MKAKKWFGQHFLVSNSTARQIVNALGDISDKKVLEIGPGLGIITQFLIKEADEFKAVEIDADAANNLQKEYEGIEIILDDFLKINLNEVYGSNFQIIGNFPYNISSQIVFKIIENHHLVDSWVGMFQLEMGLRLVAKPKDKKQYGIPSVIMPFYYEIEQVMTLPPDAFNPPPKVHSIVLKAIKVNHDFKCDQKLLFRVVKAAFNLRRKTLANSLAGIISKDILNQHQFANLRPEALTHLQFEELNSFIQENVGN
jgi:16S rRNA (adenine1518-N6/adenine1519-N6)-dimethyltransferase